MSIVAVVGALLIPAIPANAAPVDSGCASVEVVFARGSGQTDGASGEANRFRDQVAKRVKSPLSVNYYELGTSSIDGHEYSPVPVGKEGWDRITNSAGAFFSSGGAFNYGASVNRGVDELDAYIAKRIAKCPSALFILGGYSQGAQVIGETYVERLGNAERGKIVFNALFGDPRLHLPEGEGVWWDVPACRGSNLSEWRRNVPDCQTDNGSLGARKPYLPASWTSTTGLWCADADFVCGSGPIWEQSGHGTYAKEAGDIDEGAKEAVERLQKRLPPADADKLDTNFYYLKSGKTGLDVAFIIDSTGSMDGQIDQAKAFASTLSSFVATNRGRVALIEYRDAGDEFTARILTPLQENTSSFTAALNAITVEGGGDDPEAVLHALMTTMNGLDWRPGATKAAVVLTDADYHNPDVVDGSTLASVAARSLQIDPVNVYPVVPDYMTEYYESLAEATTGEVVVNSGNSSPALEEALTRIETRPVPQFQLNRYHGSVGTTMHYDATSSYSVDSEITQWDWDFDGDGTYEIVGGESTAEHQYNEPFDGFVQLRVTDANGLVANVSAPVTVGPAPAPETVPADAVTVSAEGSTATVKWTAATQPSKAWSVSVDGVSVGLVEPSVRQATITDVIRDKTVEFGVTPVASSDELGTPRVTYLDPEDSSEPEPSPTATASPSPTPSPSEPSAPEANLSLSATEVVQGGSFTVKGSGFPTSTTGSVWLHSDPVLLGNAVTGTSGSFSVQATIPKTAPAGAHTVQVTVGGQTASVPLTVVAARASALSSTGNTLSPLVVWAGLALVAVGVATLVLAVRARRKHLS